MNILDAMAQWGRDTGDYWSADNAEFEKTNPTIPGRVIRSINPMTALGSALGDMHDGAGRGSNRDMALAILQALPMFGATKVSKIPVTQMMGGVATTTGMVVPAAAKTAAMGAASNTLNAVLDAQVKNKS